MLDPIGNLPAPPCACGCGNVLSPSTRFRAEIGLKRGEYRKYIKGHYFNVINANVKRRIVSDRGYVLIWKPDHPRSFRGGYVYEHILEAEIARGGRPLPPKAEVHHVNGLVSDNRHQNLVVCPNHAYHKLLHVRTEARHHCGNPNWRRCWICTKWDDPKSMAQSKPWDYFLHRACKRGYQRAKKLDIRLGSARCV